MPGTALILGSNGRFGRHAHAALCEAGWQVRTFDRATDSLWDAAWGADVIVAGWNPAYPDWARDVPTQTKAIIEVAEACGATVILPGNVYPYGADAPALFGPETPHAAQNPLGRIRIEMEAAFRASSVQTILLRAGDFIDTEASGNWFDRVIASGLSKGKMSYLGDMDADHAWAYLPDVARAAVALAAGRDALPRYTDIAFPGYTLTGGEMHQAMQDAVNRKLRLSAMSWLPFQLLAPVWPMARCLLEMRYLWNKPHRMDAARFDTLLPGFKPTELTEALTSAVQFNIDPDKPVARGGHYLCKARPV